jgi:hypothetical protein
MLNSRVLPEKDVAALAHEISGETAKNLGLPVSPAEDRRDFMRQRNW